MWIADGWKDYELIDCGRGEKLERWKDKVLVRPDPQAIWDSPRENPAWEARAARYERSASGGGGWSGRLPESWTVAYGELRFAVKPMNFKHTGLFPEQAVNWDYIRRKLSGRARGTSVLNLFAYTGAATCAAAAAGACVCHVDAAKGMVAHAKANARLSGLGEKPVRWIVDDCVKFVEREIRRKNRYDAIVMDPPSYGRGPSGELWKLEDNLFGFVSRCAELLSDDPCFVVINSYTTGLSPSVLTYISETVFTRRFGGRSLSEELGLPVTESGLALPCGSSCRWER